MPLGEEVSKISFSDGGNLLSVASVDRTPLLRLSGLTFPFMTALGFGVKAEVSKQFSYQRLLELVTQSEVFDDSEEGERWPFFFFFSKFEI